MISAKQFLRQTEIITRRINAKQQLIQRRKEQAERITASLTGMPGGGSRESRIERAVAAYADMEAEILSDIERLRDVQRETMWLIGEMEDQRLQQILEERYLNGQLWPAIARHVHVSGDYVFKLHRLALREFTRIYQEYFGFSESRQ